MDTFMQMQIPELQNTGNTKKGHGAISEKKKFWCNQCLYATDRRNNLTRHMNTMHSDSPQVLECCFTKFPCKAAIRAHVRFFHQGGYTCPICTRTFCRKALLKRHLNVHNGYKEFACSTCNYTTSHKSNLQRHAKVHFKSSSNEKCPDITDKQDQELLQDMEKGEDERDELEQRRERPPWRLAQLPYKCPDCGERYPKQETLSSHVDREHPARDAVSLSIVNLLTSMSRARYWPVVSSGQHQEPYRKEHLQNYLCAVGYGNNSC